MRSAEPGRWLIRDARLGRTTQDCRIADGKVSGLGIGLDPMPGEHIIEAAGGELLPGLADHHVHLFAAAASVASLDLAGATELPHQPPPGTGWLRIIGVGTDLRRCDLDRVWPDRPVRAQHRSGALWTLNSAAVAVLGAGLTVDERATGQIWRDNDRLRTLLAAAGESRRPDLTALSTQLASLGVTHVTDATPDLDAAALESLNTGLRQHVLSLSGEGAGPRKIVLADHHLPDFETLLDNVRASHRRGRAVAVHAVTATALAMTIAALRDVGPLPGDRVEHAAVCDDDAADQLADLGVVVVTQPSIFGRHRQAFLRESPAQERHWLWRYGALIERGVAVAASSDAPYGDLDPWHTIGVATRREPGTLTARTVLDSMLRPATNPGGPPRTIEAGAAADLCLLTDPLDATLNAALDDAPVTVAATLIDGQLAYASPRTITRPSEPST